MEESTVRRLGGSRLTATVALTGAVLQVVYGLLACVWTYPRITGRPFEAVWGLATLGMIANVLTWLAIGVARIVRRAVQRRQEEEGQGTWLNLMAEPADGSG